jgi:4'-phosphopantetheinyl transferase
VRDGDLIRVGWLLAAASEVPEDDGWLGPAERQYVGKLRLPWRREGWRLARWTARQAITTYLGDAPGAIEIRNAADGAPEAFFEGKPAPVAISFSHRAGRAACAVAPAGTALGCDIELVEPRSDAFVRDFFTAAERDRVERADPPERPLLANLIWSAKESVLKALRTGLRADTRSVRVSLEQGEGADWSPFEVAAGDSGRTFHGWWRRLDDLVITLTADPAPEVPRQLRARPSAIVRRRTPPGSPGSPPE